MTAPDPIVWLRDLDGTGSMHPCTPHCSGAISYVPDDSITPDLLGACVRFLNAHRRDNVDSERRAALKVMRRAVAEITGAA